MSEKSKYRMKQEIKTQTLKSHKKSKNIMTNRLKKMKKNVLCQKDNTGCQIVMKIDIVIK